MASQFEPCAICMESLVPSTVDVFYTWHCGHQVHLNCFCRIYVGHWDDVVSKRRRKEITNEDNILSRPSCRCQFDIANGPNTVKGLMRENGYTMSSVRAWIRNERYYDDAHRREAATPVVAPRPDIYTPQWILVLCCANLFYVEHSFPARFEKDENERSCVYSPLEPSVSVDAWGSEWVDDFGHVPHWLCKSCSNSLTIGNPLLTFPKANQVNRHSLTGSKTDYCDGCRVPKTLCIDLKTNTRYWVCTKTMGTRTQPKMLSCACYEIDKIDVVDQPMAALEAAVASARRPSSRAAAASTASSSSAKPLEAEVASVRGPSSRAAAASTATTSSDQPMAELEAEVARGPSSRAAAATATSSSSSSITAVPATGQVRARRPLPTPRNTRLRTSTPAPPLANASDPPLHSAPVVIVLDDIQDTNPPEIPVSDDDRALTHLIPASNNSNTVQEVPGNADLQDQSDIPADVQELLDQLREIAEGVHGEMNALRELVRSA